MKVDDIRKILVLGTGKMGQMIALQCARCGYEVVAYDSFSKSLENARVKIPALRRGIGGTTENDARSRRGRPGPDPLHFPPGGRGRRGPAKRVGVEDPDLKAKVFAQFHQICQPKTVFTTNTSTLVPSMWAEATGRPAQFAALHFLDPFEANLVDVMPHPGTSPEIVELLAAFAKRIKQVPLIFKKETPWLRVQRHLRGHERYGVQIGVHGQSRVRGGRGSGGHDSLTNARRNFRTVGPDRTGYHLARDGEQRQDVRRPGCPAIRGRIQAALYRQGLAGRQIGPGLLYVTLTRLTSVQNSWAATPNNNPGLFGGHAGRFRITH